MGSVHGSNVQVVSTLLKDQQHIKPEKPAREQATSIDGEIQIRYSDANFSNHQIWNIYTRGYVKSVSGSFAGRLRRALVIQLTQAPSTTTLM